MLEEGKSAMANSEQTQTQAAQARADIFRFLSQMLVQVPEQESMDTILNETLLTALQEIFSCEAVRELQSLKDGWLNEWELKDVRQDYWGLFEVPGKRYLAPYESVYRKEGQDKRGRPVGRLFGASTSEVLHNYWEVGMQVSHEFLDLPDHIGVEVEFVGYLAAQEAAAWEAGDEAQAEAYQERQNVFMREHLGLWVEEVAGRMIEQARTPLYRAAGHMLAELPHGLLH